MKPHMYVHLQEPGYSRACPTTALAIKIVVSQDRWCLVTGSITLKHVKCTTFCLECLVFQGRWSVMAVVSQNRFLQLYMYVISWPDGLNSECTKLKANRHNFVSVAASVYHVIPFGQTSKTNIPVAP